MFDSIIEHLGEIMISAVVVLFLLNFIINDASYNGNKGLTNILGDVQTTEKWDENLHEEPGNLNAVLGFKYPDAVLARDTYLTSEEFSYKSTFRLRYEDGSIYEGTDTSGKFTLALRDILLEGGSVYKETTWDDIYADETHTLSVAYFTDSDNLYFFTSGSYTLVVEVKFDNGASIVYNIPLPVEVKRS